RVADTHVTMELHVRLETADNFAGLQRYGLDTMAVAAVAGGAMDVVIAVSAAQRPTPHRIPSSSLDRALYPVQPARGGLHGGPRPDALDNDLIAHQGAASPMHAAMG